MLFLKIFVCEVNQFLISFLPHRRAIAVYFVRIKLTQVTCIMVRVVTGVDDASRNVGPSVNSISAPQSLRKLLSLALLVRNHFADWALRRTLFEFC